MRLVYLVFAISLILFSGCGTDPNPSNIKEEWFIESDKCRVSSSVRINNTETNFIRCRAKYIDFGKGGVVTIHFDPGTSGSFMLPGNGWLILNYNANHPAAGTIPADKTNLSDIPESVPDNTVSIHYYDPTGVKYIGSGSIKVNTNVVSSYSKWIVLDADFSEIQLTATSGEINIPMDGSITSKAGKFTYTVFDDSYIAYIGLYRYEISRLLTNSPVKWTTNSCLQCNDGVPPALPYASSLCTRDFYIAAALQYAWAAEGYARLSEWDKATDMATYVNKELMDADSYCSNSPVIENPGLDCKSLAYLWPCQNN